MKFQKIQFIGLNIDVTPLYTYSNHMGQCYQGIANDYHDIDMRCDFLCDVINQSVLTPTISWSSSVLKLFMIPEFFFRGSNGAYPIEMISRIMDNMRQFTSQPQFRNWLFVLGTAVGYLQHATYKEIFNVALVQRGGTMSSDRNNSITVYKEYISGIDFIKPPAGSPKYGLIGKPTGDINNDFSQLEPVAGARKGSLNTKQPGTERTKSGLGGHSVFNLCGINFGLEICLDHAMGRLRYAPPSAAQDLIQVQLIPSAGMYVKKDNIACVNKGLVFNVDGLGSRSHCSLFTNTGLAGAPGMKAVSNWRTHKPYTQNYFGILKDQGQYLIYEPQDIPDLKLPQNAPPVMDFETEMAQDFRGYNEGDFYDVLYKFKDFLRDQSLRLMSHIPSVEPFIILSNACEELAEDQQYYTGFSFKRSINFLEATYRSACLFADEICTKHAVCHSSIKKDLRVFAARNFTKLPLSIEFSQMGHKGVGTLPYKRSFPVRTTAHGTLTSNLETGNIPVFNKFL
ncbi:MAG: hypothetical protein GY750_12575 [Lentisphaerae bacterium]|nr:hypothetical protein [Lentisphaerota bacterium]MCP4102247.1 hypothetical protein [Lentisphaerota bacterium]